MRMACLQIMLSAQVDERLLQGINDGIVVKGDNAVNI